MIPLNHALRYGNDLEETELPKVNLIGVVMMSLPYNIGVSYSHHHNNICHRRRHPFCIGVTTVCTTIFSTYGVHGRVPSH